MSNDALYVYGVVRFSLDLDWLEEGINGQKVYLISEGNAGALVHDCEEKAYASENPEEIKGMIISHNQILDRAMKDFEGVIPFSFNTIIRKGTNSAQVNLKKWLHDDRERLEMIWDKIKGKKEYGLRIYYEKDKLREEAASHEEVKKIEKNIEGKGQGLSYLLQGKVRSKAQEIFQERVNTLKQESLDGIKMVTSEVVNNPSRVFLEGEKEVLLSISVLIEEKEINKIEEFLEKKAGDFPFQIAGPFAPYSFVENGK